MHLFPYLSPFVPVAMRRNGYQTCNQDRDRKLPMNFFPLLSFTPSFAPSRSLVFSLFRKTIGYLTGLLAISFAHGVSKSLRNVLQLELKYPVCDGFRFVFDRLFRLLDNFISVHSFYSPPPSLSLSPSPFPLLSLVDTEAPFSR